MVSRFSQKSNSSASKPAKPTYRRASAAKRPAPSRPAPSRPAPSRTVVPAPKSVSVRSASVKPTVHIPASKLPPAARKKGLRPHANAPRPSAAPRAVVRPKPSMAPKPARVPVSRGVARPRPKVAPASLGRKPQAKPTRSITPPKLPAIRVSRTLVLVILGICVVLALGGVVVVNSSLFAATDIVVKGSEHVTKQTAERLVDVPKNTTLFNVNADKIAESLKANPWVEGVDVEREFPHRLVITPHERTAKAIVYIPADDIAWAVDEKGVWIAPVSLIAAVGADGKPVEVDQESGAAPEGATMLEGLDAALAVAKRAHALLLTDAPSDVGPQGGKEVRSKVVLAGLEYAKGFSPKFLEQIKDLSIPSVEAISANLVTGVEVSLGAADNITEKERVVTRLLEQESGVTYVNVRKPGAYTFRSAPL